MDWTGGTRRRYAGKAKGNAIVQRQKAHFAKARAAIGNQVIPEPLLQNAAASREHQPRMTAAHGELEYFRGSRSREPSLDGAAPLHIHQNTNRIGRKSKPPKHAALTWAGPSEEEMALITNHKRLLARDDWLGLAATRPVKIKFPLNEEQERVGKRRKIKKPKAHRNELAELRSISSPFVERHVPFESVMTGAIVNDDIRIKIGSDALLSHTERSRRSQTLPNTSIRPVSTDLGPISEESMLLKADSDGFEAREFSVGDRFEDFEASQRDFHEHNEQYDTGQWNYTIRADVHQVDRWKTPVDDSRLYEVEEFDSDAKTHQDSTDQRITKMDRIIQTMASDADPDLAGGADLHQRAQLSPYHERDYQIEVHDAYRKDQRMSEHGMLAATLSPRGIAQGQAERSYQHTGAPPTAYFPRPQSEDAENDEWDWKRFMHVRQVPSSISVAALRSSSPHLTRSTASVWPANPAVDVEVNDEMLDDRQYLDDHVVQEGLTKCQSARVGRSNFASTALSSPSPSHYQILRLVNQTPVAALPRQEEDGQDELWRQLVVGSQSSQSQSSRGGGRRVQTNNSDKVLPAPFSSAKSANEQLRSDRMTTGGSIYGATTIRSQDEKSSPDQINTSLAGHATTVGPDKDEDVEKSELALRKRRKTTNIHARGRFEPRKWTKYAPVPRAFPRVLRKGSTLDQAKSIYDMSTSSD